MRSDRLAARAMPASPALPWLLLVLVPVSCTAASVCSAAESAYHPWGTFEIGSWKEVRVVTETLDAEGRVTSTKTTVTKTTLVAADDSSFTLKIEGSLQVAGKRIRTNPELLKQGYYGEPAGNKVEVTTVGPGEVSISGRTYPVLIQQITDSGENAKKTTTDYTSEDVPPFVLKREIKAVTGDGATGDRETVVEVLAVDMPYKVLAEVKTSSFVKTLHLRRNGGASVIIEVHCIEVPGAVVAHSVDELDAAGKVVRRSTLELLDYRVAVQQPPASSQNDTRPRLFHRFLRRRP